MKQKKTLLLLMGSVIIVLLAVIGYLGWKYYAISTQQKSDPSAVSAKIIQKVENLYMTPTNEQPTVALIQDKTQLDDQEFFKNAKNGDYLLVYSKAKLAVVYREPANKLVIVGPVNIAAGKTP